MKGVLKVSKEQLIEIAADVHQVFEAFLDFGFYVWVGHLDI